MNVLETPRLRLRPFDPGRDADAMLALLNEPAFLQGIGDRGVRTREQAVTYLREWAVEHERRHGYAHRAIETRDTGAFVGSAGLLWRDPLPAPHVGYAIAAAHQGAGYAAEATRAVLDEARRQLRQPRVLAIVNPGNAASIRVLQKSGLRRIGVHAVEGHAALDLFAIDFAPGHPAT